jgi:hypothetical protein
MGPLSVESIEALHQPPEHFRISQRRYPAAKTFQGAAQAGRHYVLSGGCSFTVGDQTWELRAGDIADIPEGRYEFRVLGDGPAELVSVWELPPGVWVSPAGA